MKIKDIQIDGFGVWTGLSVDSLPDSMTLFYGPNEAGKTTLMQSIRAMLYGFTPSRREKYLPPVHGGTPGGSMRVTGPGGGYELRRHSVMGDDGVVGQLTVTSSDGLTQGHHRLQSLLGQIDESIFTNVFAIGMRELQELSTLDDTAAADELYKLSSGLDRVSLVDVLRNLKAARAKLIGKNDRAAYRGSGDEADKLLSMIDSRDRLRAEIGNLIHGTRQWSELANQRRSGNEEIAQLSERIKSWQSESRIVEIATAVLPNWRRREQLQSTIEEIQARVSLPDEAPGQLVQIDSVIEERSAKLEEVKNKRRAIREKAASLPVNRRMTELAGRIEAASQQATWVEALQEQIERLDDQIEKAFRQLDVEATNMGLDEDDRLAIADGDSSKLPDLSRQSLTVLSEPSKAVKEQSFLLKQARDESATYKERGEGLRNQIDEVLRRARADDLQKAIREQHENIRAIRKRIQLGEHLEQLKKHHEGLERESVELTTDEALPIDRAVLLLIPFLIGGLSAVYGIAHVMGIEWLISKPDPMWGMFLVMLAFMCMIVYYFGRENGRRGTTVEREDCERQIESVRRQIREIEAEREEVDSSLPSGIESLEARLRDCERLVGDLESQLPTYHNHRAAVEAYQNARTRAKTAAENLRTAKKRWMGALHDLGLSESMSPSSVRKLAEGYEVLRASRRKVDDLVQERDQRRRERSTIAKRIDALYQESLEIQAEMSAADKDDADESDDRGAALERGAAFDRGVVPVPLRTSSRSGPLEQLNHLHEEVSRQQHWIKRRRELKEQDLVLKRQQASHQQAIDRGESQRRALWAKCGVATQEQFHEMVDLKAQLFEQRNQKDELDRQIKSAIGNNVSAESVSQQIEGVTEADLERRLESLMLRTSETEARIASLRTASGELTSQMKQLAEDDRLAIARFELGCIERKIQNEIQRWQTLGTATCLMEEVCQTFENERQPETLREASSYMSQLTNGKYVRIWTPLGRNQLRIDDRHGESLPLEVLSRGTREAVFIALRLSLASAYARRGVMLPLVLDDVLVNFDGDRAYHAAKTLKTFADLGHQVMMFTCHRHIVDLFHQIDVQVRQMPAQGTPGRAYVLEPEFEVEEIEEPEELDEAPEIEDVVEQVVEEIVEQEPEPVIPAPVVVEPIVKTPEPVVIVKEIKVPAEPKIIYVDRPVKPEPAPQPKPEPVKAPEPVFYEEFEEEIEEEIVNEQPSSAQSSVGWAWYEDEMSDERQSDAAKRDQEKIATAEADNAWWR